MDSDCDRALVVFARLPVPGKVKTRLAASVGNESACAFYKECAEHVIRSASSTPATKLHLFYSDEEEHDSVVQWLFSMGLQDFGVHHQVQDKDLGVRIFSALHQVLEGGAKKAIIIGTDIPDISTDIISRAYDGLDDHQAVIGPSKDGGYYLLGLTKTDENLFQGIEWSTSTVFSSQLENIEQLGMSATLPHFLPNLQDIDTIEDLKSWVDTCGEDHPVLTVSRRILSFQKS
ncbi:hypothetical protein BSKO_08733 [Bryopsis sp. KO-2023]|nr:hypothetical protein BSKO_08733 [Bryopsis sp. KO-2023]